MLLLPCMICDISLAGQINHDSHDPAQLKNQTDNKLMPAHFCGIRLPYYTLWQTGDIWNIWNNNDLVRHEALCLHPTNSHWALSPASCPSHVSTVQLNKLSQLRQWCLKSKNFPPMLTKPLSVAAFVEKVTGVFLESSWSN